MSNHATGKAKGLGRRTVVGIAGVLVMGCVCPVTGCMHMETQRTTLEHKPQVITPEDSRSARVVVVPEDRSGR